MNTATEPPVSEKFRIVPLSGMTASSARPLSSPLSAEIAAALDASASGEVAVKSLDTFGREHRCAVLVGDLETDNDGQRLRRGHASVAQITTGTTCHLDASMIARGVEALDLKDVKILFIENVGNLVCPASFDLGEQVRVVLLSTTEGEDKPLKYPPIFKSAHLVLLTKVDVAQVLGFDCAAAVENIRRVAPQAKIIQLSARSGEGFEEWLQYLRQLVREQ
jgi:hydrogenase nickel incorporation protein HypB